MKRPMVDIFKLQIAQLVESTVERDRINNMQTESQRASARRAHDERSRALHMLRTVGKVSTAQLVEELGISDTSARTHMDYLTRNGKARMLSTRPRVWACR